jgi:site-specific DNA recombinase
LKENSAFSDRNKKHEYLLTGKIFCPCGKRQAGQGHLGRNDFFYRCTERLHSYPLPPTCKIKGVPVRNVDPVVWDKIAELMSSSDLMQKQVGRLMKNKKQKALASVNDMVTLEKEIEKLKTQEDRYNKAYGAGVFTMDALQVYVSPIRGKITNIQSQILKTHQLAESLAEVPSQNEMSEFASKAVATLSNLNFASKRAIVLKVVDKVIACREFIDVTGCIPVTDNALLCLIDRDTQDTMRPSQYSSNKSIPFEITIKLLPPRHTVLN